MHHAPHSGDYSVWQQMQLHSMDSFDKGTNVHGVANPSLAEMMYKQVGVGRRDGWYSL